MFEWDKTINAINIPAKKVIHLFRSIRDVQLALPGVPAQLASAFLCQYQLEKGVGTAVVFHLHKSELLAFYHSEPRAVSRQQIDSMLDQGLNFVESMGFLMTDQDIHLLNQADQEMLWASLPLMNGLQDDRDESPPIANTVPKNSDSGANGTAVPREQKSPEPRRAALPVEEQPARHDAASLKLADRDASGTDEPSEDDGNVKDLLAAVEALRARRPGLRARRAPPSAEEMERRRLQLSQTVGRILASL
ncbi:MAG: hypothetical protein ACWGOL_00480 [Desulfuromonadales bacterium]